MEEQLEQEQINNNENNEECIELKNIKYKTMLMSGNMLSSVKSSHDLQNLDKFLENNKTTNQTEPWSKLDKTAKIKKILTFAQNYSKENNMNEEEHISLSIFLKECLERKKLQRVKDVTYDKVTGEIKDIPSLFFNKPTKRFTLKNMDKRLNTLKSLPPKKSAHATTIKNKVVEETEEMI